MAHPIQHVPGGVPALRLPHDVDRPDMAQERHLAGQPFVGCPLRTQILDRLLPNSFGVAALCELHPRQRNADPLARFERLLWFAAKPAEETGEEAHHVLTSVIVDSIGGRQRPVSVARFPTPGRAT